jgi:hypothetical protein
LSVAEDIENGLRAIRRSQNDRAFAVVGAFMATIGSIFAVTFSVVAFQPSVTPITVLSPLIAVAAIWGTASLYFYSFPKSVDHRARPFFNLGLWFGVLVASGISFAMPILFILAVVPCVSAAALVHRRSWTIASSFIFLPVASVVISLLLGRNIWSL